MVYYMIKYQNKGTMKMLSRKNAVISLTMNIIITIATVIVIISYYCGNDGEYHIPPNFRFYLFTTDSNILCAISAAVLAVFEIRFLKTGKEIPKAAMAFKLIGCTAVALTFAVVILFLGPSTDFISMVFGGTSVYMHFAGPLLGIISFCFIERLHFLEKKLLIPAVIPTAIYGVVYVTMVVFIGEKNGGWYDFYGFNLGGFWYLSCVVIILVSLGLGALLRLVHNKLVRTSLTKNKNID